MKHPQPLPPLHLQQPKPRLPQPQKLPQQNRQNKSAVAVRLRTNNIRERHVRTLPFVVYIISMRLVFRSFTLVAAALFIGGMLAGCNRLSKQEKEMVGKYYNTALSDMKPAIELNADRSAVVRAIRPGDLVYAVSATWKATPDSLILIPDSTSIVVEEGDPAAVGNVAPRLAWPIVKYNEQTLTLIRDKNTIDYRHRYE